MDDRPPAALLIDNFTLQDVGDSLREGLTDDYRAELAGASNAPGYDVQKVHSAGVQIEVILQFLSVIVLHEQLIVDASAMETVSVRPATSYAAEGWRCRVAGWRQSRRSW